MAETLVVAALLVLVFPFAGYPQPRPPRPPEEQVGEINEILAHAHAGEHEAVVKKSEAFFAKYPLANENFTLLIYQAESHSELGQIDRALKAYERAVPFIEKMGNAWQWLFAPVFFKMGGLYRQQGRLDKAVEFVEAGLRHESQNIYYQILLGELFKQRGQARQAAAHFKDLLGSSIPTSEERTVLQIKLDRAGAGVGASIPRVDMSRGPFYSRLSFGIFGLNYVDPPVPLRDLCVLLESKWLVGCEVLPPLSMDENKILDRKRNQYDADVIVDDLAAMYSVTKRPNRMLVALAGRDIFGPNTNYVFSWQSPRNGVALVSAHRFVTGIEDFYEPKIIAGRRLGIQLISSTGSLLGLTRPTNPSCPMVYPHDLRQFQQKGSKLCESMIRERDEVLRARGGTAGLFGGPRNEETNRVYRAYYFE